MANNDLLTLGVLGVGAFMLYKPIQDTGFAVADAVGGLGMGVSKIGTTAGSIAESTGQTYKDLSKNTSNILDSTGSALSKNIDIFGNIIPTFVDQGKQLIDNLANRNKNNSQPNYTNVPKNVMLPSSYKMPYLPKSFEASIIEQAVIKPISTTNQAATQPNYKNSILYIGNKSSSTQTKTETVQTKNYKSSSNSSKKSATKTPTNTTTTPRVGKSQGTYKTSTGTSYSVGKVTYKKGHRLYKGD